MSQPFDPAAVLALMDVGVIVQDATSRVLYANRAALDLLGFAAEELVGRRASDGILNVVRPDGTPLAPSERPGATARTTGVAQHDVLVGVDRATSGDRVWLLLTAVPRPGPGGGPDGVIVTLRDVSASRREYVAAERLHQAVIRAMSEGVVVHGPDGSIRMANPGAEAILGLSEAQMAGRSPLDPDWRLVLPNGSPLPLDGIPSEITRATGEPRRDVMLGVHRPGGERAWLSVNTDPIRGDHPSEDLGVVATFTDVTLQHETQLQLERSRAHLRHVLDAIPGVAYQYRVRDDGREDLMFVSARATDLLGIPAEDLQAGGADVWRYVHREDAAGIRASMAAAASAGTLWEGDLRIRRPDGGWRWLRARAVPERVEDGLVWTGVAVDTTEAHELEERLRVVQRHEAMGDLAAGVAHNFNNMLAAIVPNLELAAAHADPALRRHVEDARLAAQSAAELVRQLLALGRDEAAEHSAEVVDLVEVAREALGICRKTFDRAIAIGDRIEPGVAPVPGRRSHLQQVVLNLLLNARDALAGCASPRIEIELRAEPAPGPAGGAGVFALRVRDTGHGMDAETLGRLGEPFFTTKAPGQGTGLGLATAYRTARGLGGTLECVSRPGAGTTFTLRLPAAREAPPRGRTAAVAAAPPLTGSVVIVDDEPLVRAVLAHIARSAGLEPVEFEAAPEALAHVERAAASDGPPPRAVLLDLSLPGMPGARALEVFRQRWPELPVLVLSGHVPPGTNLDGARRVLQKPVGVATLVQALREALERGA